MINKGILKFLEKKEAIAINEYPFPPVDSVNIAATDLIFMKLKFITFPQDH